MRGRAQPPFSPESGFFGVYTLGAQGKYLTAVVGDNLDTQMCLACNSLVLDCFTSFLDY